jgi:hypothetical protein
MSAAASSDQRQSNESRPKETKHLHFDLSHYPNHDDFTLHVGTVEHKVKFHDDETRSSLPVRKGCWR